MGREVPKQFLPLGGEPLIRRTIRPFEASKGIDRLVLVVPEDWVEGTRRIMQGTAKPLEVVPGGATRQLSSLRGLKALEGSPPDYVLIHDGVRPFVTVEMIEEVLSFAPRAVTFALRATETPVEVEGGRVQGVLDRERVYHVQTPQGFPFAEILKAHLEAQRDGLKEAPDDASLLLRLGGEVWVLEGDPRNLKITFAADLQLAEALLKTSLQGPRGG